MRSCKGFLFDPVSRLFPSHLSRRFVDRLSLLSFLVADQNLLPVSAAGFELKIRVNMSYTDP